MHGFRDNSDPSTPVCPVSATDLNIQRSGRVLLSIPFVAFGDKESVARCTMIVGPNGAGKSVLVRAMCALLAPDRGQIQWGKMPPDAQRRHRVGLVLQKPVLLRRSAQANLTYALRHAGIDRVHRESMSLSALERSGLADVAEVPAHRLSGGEQQRLALARALLLKPDILFLDEPTANVDPSSTLVIEQQLRDAVSTGLHVVMVSHDQNQVRRMADSIVLMHKGQIIEQAICDTFFTQPVHPLTQKWVRGELLV